MNARRFMGVATLIASAIPVAALARDCNEVKAEIDAKITAKGVTQYVLEVVDASNVKEGKVVGSCGGGAKKIVYRKGSPLEPALAPNSQPLEDKPTGT